MLDRDRGLVLRVHPLRETSLIVSLLGRQHGKLRLVARGARAPRSRVGASLEAGNEVDLVFSQRPGSDLGTLREVALVRAWIAALQQLEALAAGWAAVELLDRVLPEGAPEEGILDDLWGYLGALQHRPEREQAVLLFYALELRLLERFGHAPELGGCRVCGTEPKGVLDFDPLEGTWVCGRCRSPGSQRLRIPAEVISVLRELQEVRWDIAAGGATPTERRHAGRVLHRLLTCHLERYRYPRALQLLKKVDTSGSGSAPQP
jgi:DNA repair protein RecO (recombination protein O)